MARPHFAPYILWLAPAACGGDSVPGPTERLWISAVPSSPKAEFAAFVTTAIKGGRFVGAFFHGSAYRGGHDVFEWRDEGLNAAVIRFLQDGRTARLRFTPCEPSRGFDYCIMVHGDPTGVGRYQSRKRWVVRRGKHDAEPLSVPAVMAELRADDEVFEAALGTAPSDSAPAQTWHADRP